MRKLRAGLIDVGGRGLQFIKACHSFDNLELIGFAAPYESDPTCLTKVDDYLGIPKYSIADLLACNDVDIVINASHTKGHAAFALASIAAGKHVYTRAPFVSEPGESRRILEMANECGVRVGAGPDTFMSAAAQRCYELIREGLIGRVKSVKVELNESTVNGYHPDDDFYYTYAAGPIYFGGLHCLTILLRSLGSITEVKASQHVQVVPAPPGLGAITSEEVLSAFPVEISADMWFATGEVGQLKARFSDDPSTSFIQFSGAKGELFLQEPAGFDSILSFRANDDIEWRAVNTDEFKSPQIIGAGLWDMADAILHNRPHCASGKLAHHAVDVAWSIQKSAEKRKRYRVKSSIEI